MANVDTLKSENQQLQLAINELRVLNDIATTISSIQPVEEIIDQIILQCIKHLGVEEGAVSLLEQHSGQDEFHTMIRRQDSSVENIPFKLDNRLTGWMLKNRAILLSNHIQEDERFKFLDENSYSFRSILCTPLMIKGDLIGYLAVFNKKDGSPFLEEDRRLLSIIGSQSAQVIENARLYQEEKALLSLQEEMKMARDIQLNLLPNNIPQPSGFQIAATNLPSKSVGGDYYDFLPSGNEKIDFCIGDITGKGMPAAMLMANLQATFRSQVMISKKCTDCLYGINKLLYKSTESTKFATLFYGILDPEKGTLFYANGGHDAPILFRRNGDTEFLNATGLLLGVMEDTAYTQNSITFSQGDVLLLYTDGITEAMNKNDEDFGLEKLITLSKQNQYESAGEIMDSILSAVQKHAENTTQSDDITLIIIKKE